MSSSGQIVGSIIGLIAGILIPGGGFALGMALMSIGGTIGGWLDPPGAPKPDPMGDLGVNSYIRNAPVPMVVGRNKVYGGCIWIGRYYAYSENEGSSKNPQYITLVYTEFAIAFSIGPISTYYKFYINDEQVSKFDEDSHEDSHVTGVITNLVIEGDNTKIYYNYVDEITKSFIAINSVVYTKEYIAYDTYEGVQYNLGGACRIILSYNIEEEIPYILVTGHLNLINPDTLEEHNPIGDNFNLHSSSLITISDEENHLNLNVSSYLGTPTQTFNSLIYARDPEIAINYKSTAYTVVWGTIGQTNSIPSFAAEIRGITTNAVEDDCNPVDFIYWFLTDNFDGCGESFNDFDGSPHSNGSWYNESEYCNGLISYIDEHGATIEEPRFRYSNVFSSKIKGYDLIYDVLQTCNGIVYKSQGKWFINIAKSTETPIFYFSDFHRENFTVNNISTSSKIYVDFSDYPDDYWNGDLSWITKDNISYSFIVVNQTSTYIDLAEELSFIPEINDEFFITKDNITKESFSYVERGDNSVINVSRVEFINREDEYRNDIAEVNDGSRGEYHSGTFYADTNKEQTVSMIGIKRKSQAMRTAQMLLDSSCYLRYTCQFDTDIVGYMIYLGAIVGVSHSITGWERKLFRIVRSEENDDLSVKFNLLEYIPTLYNDYTPPFKETVTQKIANPFLPPLVVTKGFVNEYDGRIYIAVERPVGENDEYWSGAQIFIKRGEVGEYEYYKTITTTTPNVKLSSDVTSTQNYISFDSTELYGSFPSSGTLFLEREQIRYTSISSSNRFSGCTRGYNGTVNNSHIQDNYCVLFDINKMPYYEYPPEEIGIPLYFKFVSVNYKGVTADSNTSLIVPFTIGSSPSSSSSISASASISPSVSESASASISPSVSESISASSSPSS